MIANGFLWPHIAYFIAKTSRNPYKAEIRNLLIDSFLGGVWVPLMSFNILPSATIIFMMSMDNIATGGVRMFAKGFFAQLTGAFLVILLFGLNIRIESTMLNVFACIPMLAALPLLTVDITEEHLKMLKAPKYGYGKNMNPCIDCHTLMLNNAGRIMDYSGADFIFTGEVLGQRSMSQTKQSLHVVAKNSGYQEYILRPLSAQLLPETKPEIEGKVDRQKLLAIHGKGRKQQIEMARRYGINDYPAPAGGCLLTDPMFSKRLRDLFTYNKDFRIRDIELLKYGRQFRINEFSKVIVGRNSFENEALQKLSEGEDVVIHMTQYPGPTALVPYGGDDTTLLYAASLCALYSDAPKDEEVVALCRTGNASRPIMIKAAKREDSESLMI